MSKHTRTPAQVTYEISPRRAAAAITCLSNYIQERKIAVEKGLITSSVEAIHLMNEIDLFTDDLSIRAKTLAEGLYNTLRFTTVPNNMDGEGVTTMGVEEVGRVHLQDDISVKTEDKPGLFKWLIANELEDLITQQVNAQTLAATLRRRIKAANEAKTEAERAKHSLPDAKIVTVKPIVRAVITRG